jgi:D-amino-acid dehydrogenase
MLDIKHKLICLSLFKAEIDSNSEFNTHVIFVDATETDHVEAALRKHTPAVLVLKSEQIPLLSGVVEDALPDRIFVVEGSRSSPDLVVPGHLDTTVLHCTAVTDIWPRLLTEIEGLVRPHAAFLPPAPKLDTLLVGSGIVNLITALELLKSGHTVTVLDRMPDPMIVDSFGHLGTGATFGGMDARIFSLNESRHHLFRGNASNVAAHQPFQKRVSNAGWLSRDYEEMSPDEKNWIERL